MNFPITESTTDKWAKNLKDAGIAAWNMTIGGSSQSGLQIGFVPANTTKPSPIGNNVVTTTAKQKPITHQGSKAIGGTLVNTDSPNAPKVLTFEQVAKGQPQHEPTRAIIRDEKGVVVHVSTGPPTLHHIYAMANESTIHKVFRLFWETLQNTVKYVVWNYQDFFHQMVNWDGSWQGLLLHSNLVMRGMITVLITYGIYKAGEIVVLLCDILEEVWNTIQGSTNALGVILADAVYILRTIWEDIVAVIRSITG